MPDDPDDDLHDIETPFDKRVTDNIDADTTPFELVAALDFHSFDAFEDAYADWHPSYPVEPLVRLLILCEITDTSTTGWVERLKANPAEATALGFEDIPDHFGSDSVPSQPTVSRVENERFPDDLNDYIHRKSDRILELAHEQGNPLGLRSLEAEDKSEDSQKSKERHKKTKRNEAAQDAADIVASVVDYDRAENATYELETFLRVMAQMSAKTETARTACRNDDDYTEGVNLKPHGDTFRFYPNELDPAEVVRMHDKAAELLVEEMKQHVDFERPVDAAIDIVPVEIPGDPEKTDEAIEVIGEMFDELDDDAVGQFVQGVEDEDSDALCYKFITLNIVGQHLRVPIVLRPVPKGVPYAALVRELYWRAQELVEIDNLYLDAGFFSADGLWSLNETRSDYVMSAPRDTRLKRWLDTVDTEIAVKQDHGVFGPIKGVGRDYARTNIVAKPSIRNSDKTVLFATNKDVKDEIGFDRQRAEEETEPYSDRGHQEKSYEMVKKFLAPTESKSFRLHLYYVTFAAIAYAMWRLVDFRVKKDLGMELGTTGTVIEFSEFLGNMKDYLFRSG